MAFNKHGVWVTPNEDEIQQWLDDVISKEDEKVIMELPDHEVLSSTLVDNNIEHLNKTSYITSARTAGLDYKVSIIIPVYGALNLVKKCIESIFKHTYWPFELILVDDCSPDPLVREYLTSIKDRTHAQCQNIKVIFNKKNKGFAPTCNAGMREARGKYLCVLNSDVVVTPYWLTKMVSAIESDPSHIMVNPVTNNTALINIPMEPGRSYLDMNRMLERKSPKNHQEIMPTGFCLFFKKELTDKIGMFDEAYVSYGEDTHFWFSSLNLLDDEGKFIGNKSVMADDCYIFHERSSSFAQTNNHMSLRKAGSDRFHALNPKYQDWKQGYSIHRTLAPLKTLSPSELFKHDYRYNIAWVVKAANFCGGMNYICDIANELIERNVNVKICVIKNNPETPEVFMNELHTGPIFFKDEDDFKLNFTSKCFTEGIVIAAVAELVTPVGEVCSQNPSLTPIHHVQSYDPMLTTDKKQALSQAELYGQLKYTISSSAWITDRLVKDHKMDNILFTLQPGVDTDLFHSAANRRASGDDRFTVMVNIDGQYPFKGSNRGIDLCDELLSKDKNIRVLALGVDYLPTVNGAIGIGRLAQTKLAHMLRTEVDVFVDPSFVHSYGMPSIEALASGAEIVCWDNLGVREYASIDNAGVHIFSNETSALELADRIRLIKDNRSTPNVEIYTRQTSVDKFISSLEDTLNIDVGKKRITVITPHARKHGGPTTIINLANILHYLGHDVRLVSMYDDFSKEVIDFRNVPLYVGADSIKESDVVIVNSDNPFMESILKQPALKNAKKVLLKLSHNPRFKGLEEASLRMPVWDKIITSTEHLREKTITPMVDWRHIAWSPDKVMTVGWYHYTFPVFNAAPETREYGIIEKRMRVGYLIHDHPTKGTVYGNAIVKALKEKYGDHIDIVGIGEAKFNKPQWLTYIYRGTRMEIASVMKQCDIWLGTSTNEGLGRMTLEAMAAGCAVVATDTGADFLKDGENCLLYKPGVAQAGGEAVDKLIQNKRLFKQLVINGYATAVAAADPYAYIRNIKEVISQL